VLSFYIIENDTSLRDMIVEGLLDTKVDPAETNYALDVGQQTKTKIKPVPMNPSATVVVSPSEIIELNVGNTPVSISVSTGPTAKSVYHILASRKSPSMRLLGDDLSCMICTSVAFKPHSYPCKHVICGSCVVLFSRINDSCAFCQSVGVAYDLEKKYAGLKLACGSCKEKMYPLNMESHKCTALKSRETGVECGACRMRIFKTEQKVHDELVCVKAHPIPAPKTPELYKCLPWEIKDASGDAPSLNGLYELTTNYTQLLANGVSKNTVTALNELFKGYSTFFQQYTKVKKDLTKSEEEANYHIKMALLAEEQMLMTEYYTAAANTAGAAKNSCTGDQDGFMEDEIAGLLLGLGITASASEATKIKTMEEERQRLVNSNDQDGASEISGLLSWKLKQTKIVGYCGDKARSNEESSDGLSLEKCIQKLSFAVAINPTSFEANIHLGRLLIETNRNEALLHIGRAITKDIDSLDARFLMGQILLGDPSTVTIGIEYLDPIFQDYSVSGFTSGLLAESIISLSSNSFQAAWLTAARAQAAKGSLTKAREECQALISLLTRHLGIYSSALKNRRHVNTIYFAKSCTIIVYSLVELVKIAISTKGNSKGLSTSLSFLLNFMEEKLDSSCRIEVCRVLIQADSADPSTISNLGSALLGKYDEDQNIDLEEIEKTFLASIDAEYGLPSIESRGWFVQAVSERYAEKKLDATPPTSKVAAKTAPAASSKKSIPAKGAPVPSKKTIVGVKSATTPSKPTATKPVAISKPAAAKPASGKSKVAPLPTKTPPKSIETKEAAAVTELPVIDKKPLFTPLSESRLGLARVYQRKDATDPRIEEFYNKALELDPLNSDIYIELSAVYENEKNLEKAAHLFASYPFSALESATSQDELYIHGEVCRLFVKTGKLRDPILIRSLIEVGRNGGIRSIERYTEEMDKKGDACAELMEVYAGAGRKPKDDADMITFFKARFWL
jgi:tetratricopeptide (TPR) repeat protein